MLDKVQIITVCLMLLQVTFDLCNAQKGLIACQSCPPGFYTKRNCSEEPDGRLRGVQCSECTKCSAEGQLPLKNCSQFSDSVCGTVPTVPLVAKPADENWVIITATGSSVFLILSLILLTCRNDCSLKCNKLLPQAKATSNKLFPSDKDPNPPENRVQTPDNKPVRSEFLV